MDPNKFEFESIKAKIWLRENKNKERWRQEFRVRWGDQDWFKDHYSNVDTFANHAMTGELKPADSEWKKVMQQDVMYLFVQQKRARNELWELLRNRWGQYKNVGVRQWKRYVSEAIAALQLSDDIIN